MSRVEHIGRATPVVRIYALCEYPSWEPRYVGKTIQRLGERHKAHIRDAKRGGKRPVNYWLRKKLARGERLAIKLLEWAGDDWQARERHWIATYRAAGRLLNLTDGGEGLAGLKKSATHRKRISAALRTGEHFNCLVCGSPFYRKPYAIKKGQAKFCSRQCANTHNRGGRRG